MGMLEDDLSEFPPRKAKPMRKATVSQAEPAYGYEGQEQPKYLGGFEITKIVREHVGIEAGGDFTYGQLLDRHLEEVAMQGGEVQSITLEVNPDAWKLFAADVNGRR